MEKQLMGYSVKETDAILEVLRKENEDLKRRDSEMEAELFRMKEEIESHGTALSGEEIASRDEALIESLKTENDDLKQQISQMESRLSQLNEEIENRDEPSDVVDEELFEALRTENDDLKQQISQMESKLSLMSEEMKNRDAASKESPDVENASQNEELIENLKTENDGLKQQISQMEGELSSLKDEIVNSAATAVVVPEEVKEEEAPSQNDALFEALRAKNDDLKRRISQMERELSGKNDEMEASDNTEEEAVCEVTEEEETCDVAEETEALDSVEEAEACDSVTEEVPEEVIIPISDNNTVETNNGGVYMNPKINELKAEKEKNLQKIAEITAQNKEIDAQITELENTDIIGIVRQNGITPEQLDKLIMSYLNGSQE